MERQLTEEMKLLAVMAAIVYKGSLNTDATTAVETASLLLAETRKKLGSQESRKS